MRRGEAISAISLQVLLILPTLTLTANVTGSQSGPSVKTDKSTYAQGDIIHYTGFGFTHGGPTESCLSTDNATPSLCVPKANSDGNGNVMGTMQVGTNVPPGPEMFFVEDLTTNALSVPVQLTITTRNQGASWGGYADNTLSDIGMGPGTYITHGSWTMQYHLGDVVPTYYWSTELIPQELALSAGIGALGGGLTVAFKAASIGSILRQGAISVISNVGAGSVAALVQSGITRGNSSIDSVSCFGEQCDGAD